MFCPRCGRYLNRNIAECPYCGAVTSQSYRGRGNADGGTKPADGLRTECGIGDEAKFNVSNKNFLLGFFTSAALFVSLFIPWTYWSNGDATNYYNAFDLISFTWNNSMDTARLYPLFIGGLGGFSALLLLFMRGRRFGIYSVFAIALFACVGCFLFAYGSMMYTGMQYFVGLGLSFISSILLLYASTNLMDKYYGIEYKKKEKKKKGSE